MTITPRSTPRDGWRGGWRVRDPEDDHHSQVDPEGRLAGRYCVVESVSGGSGGARVGFLKVTFYPPYKRDFPKTGYPLSDLPNLI